MLANRILADRICEELGIRRESSLTDLIAYLEKSGHDPLEGLLATEDSREAAREFFDQVSGLYRIRIVRQLAPIQQRYCRVQIEGEINHVLVALLDDCVRELPTDMESLILMALVQGCFDLKDSWGDSPGLRGLRWRGRTSGLAIIAEPISSNAEVARTVAAVFGLEDAGLGLAVAPSSITLSATDIRIGTPTCCFSEVQGRLVFEAASATHPKWQFLSLYRILEHAYLRNIKETLIDEFDKDANKAVEEAKKKLSSEVNQLADLMKCKNLDTEFVAFNDEFEKQLALQNRYINAINRSAELDIMYRDKEIAKKAVLRFYKIRCSIAHAGTSSVIYEQMPDANKATIALLPTVEAIIQKSLNISLTGI